MTYKLLFVCLGNICRSPSAENIMNYLLEEQELTGQITCDSAGTSSYHLGSPPDRRMSAAAERRGISLTGKARQFVSSDLEDFDLILAMDRDNYRDILSLDSSEHHQKVKLLCEFCRNHQDEEVPDPYYGGQSGFDYVIDLLLDACGGLLDTIVTEHDLQA